MKKISLLFSFLLALTLSSNAFAHTSVKTDGITLQENGLKFEGLMFAMEPQNRQGTLFFTPSNPNAKPVDIRNNLEASNTVGALKEAMVKAINAKIGEEGLNTYQPITVNDIAVFGGHSVMTENAFTDAKVIQAGANGSQYRVQVTFTPIDTKKTVKTSVHGFFSVYGTK